MLKNVEGDNGVKAFIFDFGHITNIQSKVTVALQEISRSVISGSIPNVLTDYPFWSEMQNPFIIYYFFEGNITYLPKGSEKQPMPDSRMALWTLDMFVPRIT
jgi:hypothetical protein